MSTRGAGKSSKLRITTQIEPIRPPRPPTLNLNLQFHRKFIHPPIIIIIIIIVPSFSLLIELIVDHMNQLHRATFTD